MRRLGIGPQQQISRYFNQFDRAFIHKITGTYGSRILIVLVGLASTAITSRALGPEGRGIFAVAVTVGNLGVQLGNLGLHAANTYFLAREPKLLPVLLGNSLTVGLLFGSSIALLGWIVCDRIPELCLLNPNLLALSLLWIPLSLTYLLSQNLLLGLHAVGFYNRVEIGSKILVFAAIILLFLLNQVNVFNLLVANLIVLFLSNGINVLNLYQRCYRIQYFYWSILHQSFDYGIKAYVAALFAFMVLKSDLLMIQQRLGSTPAGLYSIAVNMTDMLYIFPVVVGSILFPTLSALSSDSEKWEKAKTAALSVLGVMFLFAALAALVGKWAIAFLFGSDYLGAYPSFLILLAAIVILGVNSVLMNYFGSIGMPIITVISPALAFGLNITLNAYWIPRYNIQGAAASSLMSYLLMLLISLIFIKSLKMSS